MKIEKRSENSYRIRKKYKGKIYTVSLPYKPTQKEALELMAKKLNEVDYDDTHLTFFKAYTAYLELKSNILSPSTKRGYSSLINAIPEDFKHKYISAITNNDIQKLVNDYSATHSPKTTRNYYSFITVIVTTYNKNINVKCALPQAKKVNTYIPSSEDVKALFQAIKGSEYEVLFKLASKGMRRSEILALTMDDIKDCEVTINKVMVQDEHKNWVIKNYPKTTASERVITIPPELYELILEKGLYTGSPTSIDKALKGYLKKLGIPAFSIHKLRHFFASEAHFLGIADKYIMDMGGWETSATLQNVYQHALNDKKKEMENKINEEMSKLY